MLLGNESDEHLMLLYQNGSEAAFQELYRRHSARILAFIGSRVRNQERAHDIFQEVFVKIHKSKHLYNKKFPVLPWIFTVTKNALVDEARKLSAEQRMLRQEASLPPQDLPQATAAELGTFIQDLPPAQRQALELRYYEEKTFEDIAKILNTSSVNVRQLVSRGLKRLKMLVHQGDEV